MLVGNVTIRTRSARARRRPWRRHPRCAGTDGADLRCRRVHRSHCRTGASNHRTKGHAGSFACCPPGGHHGPSTSDDRTRRHPGRPTGCSRGNPPVRHPGRPAGHTPGCTSGHTPGCTSGRAGSTVPDVATVPTSSGHRWRSGRPAHRWRLGPVTPVRLGRCGTSGRGSPDHRVGRIHGQASQT